MYRRGPIQANLIYEKPHGRRKGSLGNGDLHYKRTLYFIKQLTIEFPEAANTSITLKYDPIYQNSSCVQHLKNMLLHGEVQLCLNKPQLVSQR